MTAYHRTIAMRNNRRQYGVTLLEALIAMFILALGMMSYSAVDARLRVASDIAKQRSEALRIAQEDMENFRAFGTMTPDGTIANNLAYNSIVNAAANKAVLASSVITTTNATYAITRNIVDGLAMKDVMIQVGWNDRNGTAQRVVLRSVIAGVAPILAAAITIAPTPHKPMADPLGRNVIVPIPAKDLGDGTSVFKPTTDSTRAFRFNNDTGEITAACGNIAPTTQTPDITSAILTSCTTVSGYLLSGYIRFSLNMVPDPAAANSAPPGGLSIRTDLSNEAPPANAQGRAKMLNVDGFWPAVNGATGVVPPGSYDPVPDCASESLKTVFYTATTSTGKLVVVVPAGLSLTADAIAPYAGIPAATILTVTEPANIEHFVRYICVVYPIDLDGEPSTPKAWTGRATIWPAPTPPWSLGTTSSTYKVCRFSSDYNGNGYVSLPPPPYAPGSETPITKVDNTEHPYAYLNVMFGVNNQNYMIVSGNYGCPTDNPVEVDGRGKENYTNETTVLHQP